MVTVAQEVANMAAPHTTRAQLAPHVELTWQGLQPAQTLPVPNKAVVPAGHAPQHTSGSLRSSPGPASPLALHMAQTNKRHALEHFPAWQRSRQPAWATPPLRQGTPSGALGPVWPPPAAPPVGRPVLAVAQTVPNMTEVGMPPLRAQLLMRKRRLSPALAPPGCAAPWCRPGRQRPHGRSLRTPPAPAPARTPRGRARPRSRRGLQCSRGPRSSPGAATRPPIPRTSPTRVCLGGRLRSQAAAGGLPGRTTATRRSTCRPGPSTVLGCPCFVLPRWAARTEPPPAAGR
mmetsp:Transcript_93796/g.265258  ORF Transcript_93796/g.265258 Transcript_93796/m.265258 type:complete len:289 (-) Transcript_93796:172-1038(-)